MTQPQPSTSRRLHAVADSRDTTFSRDGLTFNVTLSGPATGPAVVLLHGFPGSRHTWRATTDLLVGEGVRCVALEQRGYGAQCRPANVDRYRLSELAADVEALSDQLDLGPAHLVGHDWGGIVAWALAATEHGRWRTATILSTPHPRAFATSMTRSLQALRSTYAVAFQTPLLPEVMLTAGRGRLLRAGLIASGLDPETASIYSEHLGDHRAMRAALNWYRAAFRYPHDMAGVGPSRLPTTYLWSTNDAALGRRAAEDTAAHVHAPYELRVLNGASHWIPETRPELAATAILDTLSATPRRNRQ